MSYAEGTKVPQERSRNEIESTLKRYGASSFGYMSDPNQYAIVFKVEKRSVKIVLPKPPPRSTTSTAQRAADAEDRRRWRALLLVIKAKLEAVESKIATFENEFLPYTVMPNGETVAEHFNPQLQAMFDSGKMPTLMLTVGE